MLIIKQVEIFVKKEFAKAALNKNSETFAIYIIAFKASKITIDFLRVTYVIGDNFMQFIALKQNRAFIKILIKYSDFAIVFLFKLAIKLTENMRINKHVIELKKTK